MLFSIIFRAQLCCFLVVLGSLTTGLHNSSVVVLYQLDFPEHPLDPFFYRLCKYSHLTAGFKLLLTVPPIVQSRPPTDEFS